MAIKFPLLYYIIISGFTKMPAAETNHTIEPRPALGAGQQYRYEPLPGEVQGWPKKISELEKDGTIYSYEQTDELSWNLRVKSPTTEITLNLFSGPRLRETRLVDVRVGSGKLEVLLSHSQGYYFYLLEAVAGGWRVKAVIT